MQIHCLQHVAFETPGTISEWALLNGHAMSYTHLFENEFVFPDLGGFDALLIMGGSMNVDEDEKFSWLTKEKIFIKNAIDAGKKVMGICLGAQLVARVLGCAVYAGKEKEIGFFPVSFSPAARNHSLFNHFSDPCMLFHWHGDTFDLPEDARVMASSTASKHQAFLINVTVLGLQFHLEMNEAALEQMLLHDGGELAERGNYIQEVGEIRKGFGHLGQNRKDMFVLLDKFFNSSPGPFSMG